MIETPKELYGEVDDFWIKTNLEVLDSIQDFCEVWQKED